MALLGAERADLRGLAERLGEPAWRGDQIFRWVHSSGVLDPGGMTNLPLALRARLGESLDPRLPAVEQAREAGDGTVKLVLALGDGYRIESVVIPRDDDDRDDRATLCVSTQVGCRLRCRFCRSGAAGFRRDLDASEIVGQVAAARARHGADAIGRVVLMGIGEPMDNYDAVARSLRILSDGEGAGFPPRRLVVSTVGRPAGIRRLGEDFGGRVGLAVSLHAADPETRAALVPARDCAGPDEVMRAVRAYPLPSRERVTIEVVLARGLNDSPRHAERLAGILEGVRCRVNIIPLNPFEGLDLEPPAEERVLDFQRRLARRGLTVLVRRRRGASILAGCGQLAFSGRKDG